MTRNFDLNAFYDGKKIWEEYMSMGNASSYRTVTEWCRSNGMVNPKTGGVNLMGVKFAMWRYAARNPEEAYKAFKEWNSERGDYDTFEEFCQIVYDHCVVGVVIGGKDKRKFYEKYLKGFREQQEVKELATAE